jgi:hypothetical protein
VNCCRFGELLQIWWTTVCLVNCCTFGELMHVWRTAARLVNSCMFGELLYVGLKNGNSLPVTYCWPYNLP